MIKQWDVFTETANSRRSNSLRVSLSKRSLFAVNQLGYEALNKAEAIELMFDKVNKLIGMRPCPPEQKNAFKLRQQGKSNSYYVRARAFCAYYNIKVNQTVVFDEPEVDEDGVLTLDLNKVTEISPRKPRKPKQTEERQEAFVLGGEN